MCDALHTRPIKTDKGINATGPLALCQEITRPAQIPLAFFADCPDEQQRAFRLNPASL